MSDIILKKELIKFIEGGQAFHPLKKFLDDLSPEFRNKRINKDCHTIWEILEHMRIAQEDILRFTVEKEWKSPKWPDEYWKLNKDVNDEIWYDTYNKFFEDLNTAVDFIKSPLTTLTDEIPHAKGYTYLREMLLIGEHNAYHTGQLLQIKKSL